MFFYGCLVHLVDNGPIDKCYMQYINHEFRYWFDNKRNWENSKKHSLGVFDINEWDLRRVLYWGGGQLVMVHTVYQVQFE